MCCFLFSGEIIQYNDIASLERALKAHGKNVAGFLVEPIQGEAGVVVPTPGYLRECAALCAKYNVLLIADEVQCGLGRTGRLLASEHDGVRPDIALLGKALTGGVLPASAVLADRDIMLCIQPGEHGSTFGGNPLACAVAITALQVLKDENLSMRSDILGKRLMASLKGISSSLITEIRGQGLFCAIVINENNARQITAWDICMLLKHRGLLAKPTRKNIIRLAPPLVMKDEQLQVCTDILKSAFKEIETIRVNEIPGYVAEN